MAVTATKPDLWVPYQPSPESISPEGLYTPVSADLNPRKKKAVSGLRDLLFKEGLTADADEVEWHYSLFHDFSAERAEGTLRVGKMVARATDLFEERLQAPVSRRLAVIGGTLHDIGQSGVYRHVIAISDSGEYWDDDLHEGMKPHAHIGERRLEGGKLDDVSVVLGNHHRFQEKPYHTGTRLNEVELNSTALVASADGFEAMWIRNTSVNRGLDLDQRIERSRSILNLYVFNEVEPNEENKAAFVNLLIDCYIENLREMSPQEI